MKARSGKHLRPYFGSLKAIDARLALVIGYHTGMRRGEICAIRWDQVDIEAG